MSPDTRLLPYLVLPTVSSMLFLWGKVQLNRSFGKPAVCLAREQLRLHKGPAAACSLWRCGTCEHLVFCCIGNLSSLCLARRAHGGCCHAVEPVLLYTFYT